MKTLVTGGAGFIGSNLVRKLLDAGRDVVVADDLSRGCLQNLRDLGINPGDVGIGISDFEIDLRDFSQARRIIQGADTVYHLAARIGSIDYLHGSSFNEFEALQSNLVIDCNVLRACLECNVKKLVYASSAAVYPIILQDSPDVILSEDMLELARDEISGISAKQIPVSPDGGYGWAKLMGEIQLTWMSDIKIGIARIFNVYGENQDLVRAVHVNPSLFLKANRHPEEELIVWGDGKQTRDFLYVMDCVDALIRLEQRVNIPSVLVNIGSGQTVSIGDIAKEIVAISGKDIPLVFDVDKPVGPISRTADITKSLHLLEWSPQTNLDDGLYRMYMWMIKRLAGTGTPT
jgi:GDP-D-mannose 3',5'-epimerase